MRNPCDTVDSIDYRNGYSIGMEAHSLVLLLLLLLQWIAPGYSQIAWTPIYVDGNSQVDLWTQESKGCHCPFDSTRQDCACCVHDGGCHCGRGAPNRCSQCGLEQHCSNMCNITIDSRYLSARSGKTFGQIKSPSMEGPSFCWYLLQPDTGQRVEIQVYRLVSVGRFNGTSCEGGFLQLVDGSEAYPRPGDTQICGTNERFTPPVVLFGDKGAATLLFHVGVRTLRSQFLAYFSFTPSGSVHGAGFQAKGGRRIEHTECDWLYQDFSCREPGSCVLASPGYPGLYPPNRMCKYHITTSSIHTQVHIIFNALLLPHNHCATDYIAIYQGSTSSSPLLTTVCANRKTRLQYSGPNLLLEFSSGPSVPPYDYNGFLATLEFTEKVTSTEPSNALMEKTTEPGIMMDGTGAPRFSTVRPGCDLFFSGNDTRSGHFNSRALAWRPSCTLSFQGRPTDIVHVSLFNYVIRARSCQSFVEVYDGPAEEGVKPLKRICSPTSRHARDPSGRFTEQETFISSDSTMTVILRRQGPAPSASEADTEFVDGAFLFHDEQVDGTLRPETLCDVDYYGLSSPVEGVISNPGTQHLFWNVEGALKCSQRFIPAANQSVTITVEALDRLSPDPHCHTQCGDAGCQCVTNLLPLAQMDHLLLVTDTGKAVSCLCGGFQQQWLPVSLRSWSPIRMVYSVAHYSWTMKGFSFSAVYTFNNDAACGHSIITTPSGEILSRNVSAMAKTLNYYFHQKCTWLLDSKQERQLTIEMETNQNRMCTAWNVTVHQYEENTLDGTGKLLHTFCPRDRIKKYSLPWKMNTVLLRLHAMTTTLPEYMIRWHSQVVEANSRVSGPTSTPVLSSSGCCNQTSAVTCLSLGLLFYVWCCALVT